MDAAGRERAQIAVPIRSTLSRFVYYSAGREVQREHAQVIESAGPAQHAK